MVRLKLRTCSTNGISMKTSRLAQSVTSHSLIIVREFALMQGISEPFPGNVKQMRARRLEIRLPVRGLEQCPGCHPERSEGSLRPASQTLRCAQGDRHSLQMSARRQEILHLLYICAILPIQRGCARRYGTSPLACSFHKRCQRMRTIQNFRLVCW